MDLKTQIVEKLLRQAAAAAETGLVREAVARYKKVLQHDPYCPGACEYLAAL